MHVTWGAIDLSWLEQVQASPVGGSGAAHLYVFYVSWSLWEAHLYVFYVSGRLRGVGCLTNLNAVKRPGGSAKQGPEAGREGGDSSGFDVIKLSPRGSSGLVEI